MVADEIKAAGVESGLRVGVFAPTPALRAGLSALLNDIEVVADVYNLGSVLELSSLLSSIEILLIVPGPGVDQTLVHDVASTPELAILLMAENGQGLAGFLPELAGRPWGVLSLEASPEELAAAINALAAGLVVGLPVLLNPQLRDVPISLDDRLIDPLTDRELEVLQLLAQGLPNKEIASNLDISAHTVKFHISGIYTKLGATNRTEAVRLGVRQGFIVL
jgi:DNA-binding NarL/FixJ family response regulator